MKKRVNFAQPMFIMLLVITIFAIATVFKATTAVLMPVTMAVLFSCVFEPPIIFLNRKFHLPWGLGILLVFIIVGIAIAVLIVLLTSSISAIVKAMPKYEQRFTIIYKTLADWLKIEYNPNLSVFANLWQQIAVRDQIQNFALTFSNSVISFFKVLGLISLFAIFFLLEMRDLREKIEYAFGHTDKGRVTVMITDIIEQVTRYLSVKFVLSAATGAIVFIGLSLVGLDFPIVWAFLAFILNFIPTFGSIISVLATSLFGVIEFFPHPGPISIVFILMSFTNFTIGNILEPRIMGRNLGLSPFVIIVALTFWGWLWGFAGLIIGVPMMVILKIICENVDFLEPAARLLGSYKPSKEPVQEPQSTTKDTAEDTTKDNTQTNEQPTTTISTK